MDALKPWKEGIRMARLIDAEPIVQFIKDGLNNPNKEEAFGHTAVQILTEIEYAPTVNVQPVAHGRGGLLGVGGHAGPVCSVCQDPMSWFLSRTTRYCPNCGAKMDGGDNNE